MKKMLLFVPVLLLTACATGHYQPKLAAPAADPVKFQQDVTYCNADQVRRSEVAAEAHKSDSALIGATGLLGYGAVSANADPSDDWYKTPGQMVDECMTAKGYKVIPQ